jgi:hypothetical protein
MIIGVMLLSLGMGALGAAASMTNPY